MARSTWRRRMLGAPWWAWIPLYGIPFGFTTTFLFGSHRHHSWVGLSIKFAFLAIFFGVSMSLAQRSRLAEMRAELDEIPNGQERSAVRASWRGPIPVDPTLRRSALAIAEFNHAQMDKWWPISPIIMFVVAMSSLVMAVTGKSIWWGLLGGFLVIMLGLVIWSRIAGGKRIERLRNQHI